MDTYFSPLAPPSRPSSRNHHPHHGSVTIPPPHRVAGGMLEGMLNGYSPQLLTRQTLVIIIFTLMDMCLQYGVGMSRIIGIVGLVINSLQILVYCFALYLVISHGRDGTMIQMPATLLCVGYIIAISILINSGYVHTNLSSGWNAILNLPRVALLFAVVYMLWPSGIFTKDTKLSILFMVIGICLIVTLAMRFARRYGASEGLGICGFLVGCVTLYVANVSMID